MLLLPDITLCGVDTRDTRLAVRSLRRSMAAIEFGRVVLFSDREVDGVPTQIIDPINSIAEYSNFVLHDLPHYIHTDFALITQWDGYAWNPDAWSTDFLSYDYIGAPWNDGAVGNGGFSLRSRRLMLMCTNIQTNRPEDVAICRVHRAQLEADGMRFAPLGVAQRFSFETVYKPLEAGIWPFGFHGVRNIFLTDSEAQIVEFVGMIDDVLAASEHVLALLRNCYSLSGKNGQDWGAVAAIARRILQVQESAEVRQILGAAAARLNPL